MKKSPQAFRTISEVSKTLDVPAHVLPFWESRFSQIKPVKRGGGRRYYRPEDVDLIRGIRDLLYTEGLTIKGAQKVLRDKGVRHVIAVGKGDDARIAEADSLWDEPDVGEVAASKTAAPAPSKAEKPSPAKKPVAPAPDPRQSSLFADYEPEDGGDGPLEESIVPAAPETPPSQAAQHAASPAPAQDEAIDHDALREVFGKLKALRASMDKS